MFFCKFCLEDRHQCLLINPCKCSGTIGYVHINCLVYWCYKSKTLHCQICNAYYYNRALVESISYFAFATLECCAYLCKPSE